MTFRGPPRRLSAPASGAPRTGRLAAAYWTSDYGEFCGGRARLTYMGQVPACRPLVRTRVIYGKEGKGRTPTAPVDRLRPSPGASGASPRSR